MRLFALLKVHGMVYDSKVCGRMYEACGSVRLASLDEHPDFWSVLVMPRRKSGWQHLADFATQTEAIEHESQIEISR